MEPTKEEMRKIDKDPAIERLGKATFLEKLRNGTLDDVVSIARRELLDWEYRAKVAGEAVTSLFDDDRDVVATGIDGLRRLNVALCPWWLAYMPDAWRWAVVKRFATAIDIAWRKLQTRIAQFTPDEFVIWRYFMKRTSHPSRWETLQVLLPLAIDNRRAAWNAWNWTSSTPEQTVAQPGFFDGVLAGLDQAITSVVNYSEQVYEGAEVLGELLGDEYGDEVIAASTAVVKFGAKEAEALGLIDAPVTTMERYIPDPRLPCGYRVVIDTIQDSPLARFGEGIITGVGNVDDSLRRVGLGKSARLATMAVGTGVAVTGVIWSVAKALTYVKDKAAAWLGIVRPPVIVPSLPPIAPPIPAAPWLQPWMQHTVEAANLPWFSQVNINLCLEKGLQGAAGGFKLAGLGKVGLIAGGIGLLYLVKEYANGVTFALFGIEETMQTDSMTISTAVNKYGDHEWAAKKATDQIAHYEKCERQAWIPFIGPIFAFTDYIRTAKENTAKWREWSLNKIETMPDAKRAHQETLLPPEAKPVKEKKTKEQRKVEWTEEIKTQLAAVFLELRRIRVFLGHKRIKLGEAYTFDAVNVPLIRTWVTRDRAEIVKDRDAAQTAGKLEEWVEKLQAGGYDTKVINKSDVEGLIETKYGFKPYKKISKK